MLTRLEIALLRLLSRKPGQGRYPSSDATGVDDALRQLVTWFPGFLDAITGKAVVDFGSGEGFQALALARSGARRVLGVEISGPQRAKAAALAERLGVRNATFSEGAEPESRGMFDVAILQNSMEHFSRPAEVLQTVRTLLRPGGRVYVTFGPPWFSPYGAHMGFFCKVPWVHLLFSEKAVMAVRASFTDDRATRYEQIRGGLNRMSLRKFERLLGQSGLRPTYESYCYVLNQRFLHGVPLLRELLLYQINVVLVPR